MEDRYKVVATFPNGKMVTIMSEREIKHSANATNAKYRPKTD